MPGVNGHVLSSPALQASMSISSLEPAARTLGWFASTAMAGSFCLFCAKGDGGLPFETRVSPPCADAGAPRANRLTTVPNVRRRRNERRINDSFLGHTPWPTGDGDGIGPLCHASTELG